MRSNCVASRGDWIDRESDVVVSSSNLGCASRTELLFETACTEQACFIDKKKKASLSFFLSPLLFILVELSLLVYNNLVTVNSSNDETLLKWSDVLEVEGQYFKWCNFAKIIGIEWKQGQRFLLVQDFLVEKNCPCEVRRHS